MIVNRTHVGVRVCLGGGCDGAAWLRFIFRFERRKKTWAKTKLQTSDMDGA